MQLYSIIDENNYITHCEWHEQCPVNGTPLLNNLGFVIPRLVDGVLTETFVYIPTIEEKDVLLKKVLNKILLYSRALAMGKSVDDDLDYFEKAYTNKYEMCKGLKVDPYNTLYIESVSEGFATVQEYKDYVIEKYELGKGFYDTALQLSEVMRKLVINDCANNEINKAVQRLTLVDELPTTITVAQVSQVFNQVMAI
jgi:hypothetical protein